MKGVFVVLDGIADRESNILGGKTPLEIANTPNLDYFAEKGKMDYCYTVKNDYVPESNEGVLSLLGYDPFLVGRGALEAIGVGAQLKNGDLALRCNFATIDDLDACNILDRRAGRTLTTKEARILAEAIKNEVKLNFKFDFYPSVQHRGVLVIKGGFSDNIADVEERNGKLVFSQPLDDIDDSKLSADLLNLFVRKSHEVLAKHPINLLRMKKGLFPANVLICRGAESDKLRLKKIRGRWIALGYMPLEKGIAKAVGMEVYKFSYPKLKNMDVYENLYSGLYFAIKYGIKMLKKYRKKFDYFYVHFKETDLPGHDNKPLDKVRMIELIDKRFFGFMKKYLKNGGKLIVTGDHATVCKMKAHTSDPVPILSYPNIGVKRKNEGNRFTEADGLKGKKILGRRLLIEKMYVK